MSSKYAARRLNNIPKVTVWTEFTPACAKHSAINLAQGFPSWAPTSMVLRHAGEASSDPAPLAQQYAPQRGHPLLLAQLQKKYSSWLSRDIALEELCVCNGTTQALNIVMTAFVNPEEEVVVFEPYFDLYDNDIALAHGQSKFVPLRPDASKPLANEWKCDFEELERAVVKGKTKGILLNTPQNVPGKVWSRAELEKIADIARRHDLLVFADEVYERFVFDGSEHISIASMPGMYERTITMCSAGKTFNVTGWKIGWCVGPANLMVSCMQVQAHQAFSIATPLQVAVARAMAEADDGFYAQLLDGYVRRRKLLVDGISAAGLTPHIPQGSYFAMADISQVPPELYLDKGTEPLMPGAATDVGRDWKFCRWMVREIGVGCLPCSAFCSVQSRPLYENYVRFAFCKTEADITEAAKRMKEKLAPLLKSSKKADDE